MKLFGLNSLFVLFLFFGIYNFCSPMDKKSIQQAANGCVTFFNDFITHYKNDQSFRSTTHKCFAGVVCGFICTKSVIKMVKHNNFTADNVLIATATGYVTSCWLPKIKEIINPDQTLKFKAAKARTRLKKFGLDAAGFVNSLLG